MHVTKLVLVVLSGLLFTINLAQAQEADEPNSTPAQRHKFVGKQGALYAKQLGDAETLIKNGKPAEAYALLEPLDFEHAGDEHFDYLLGVAALDSGKSDKATLVFERVLAVNPKNAAARLEIARAYYQLGDLLRAKTEFEVTLRQNPPEAARVTIQKYLDTIAAQDPAKTTHISAYLEARIGHDSNINNAMDKSQTNISVPPPYSGIYTAILDPSNIQTADNYLGVAAGSVIVHQLNTLWGIYVGVDLHQLGYFSQTNFNALDMNGRTGVIFDTGANRFRTGLMAGEYTLGNARNRGTLGLNAEWGHKLSPSNQLNVFAQYQQYHFAQAVMESNNFDQLALGAGLNNVLADGNTSLSASVYTGTETDVAQGGRLDGAKKFNGLRVGTTAPFGDSTMLFANAGVQLGDYSKFNTYFQNKRSETIYDLTLGLNWNFNKLWTLRPQLAYTQSNSNIELYKYTRTDVSLTLRRDF